jgi:osmoprotectant transport system substrate-binding protein
MRKYRNGFLGAILVVVLAMLLTACGSGEGTGTGNSTTTTGETTTTQAMVEGPTITIGSANFSESALVAEIYAQVLEDAGFPVKRNLNVGNREIYAKALEDGGLDLVPEYLGSALSYLGGTPTSDTAATAQALSDAWKDAGISVLEPAPAQDKNGVVVRQDTADSLGLSKVSDLAGHDNLVLGGPPECPEREFCLLGLQDVYGLKFAEFKPLDAGGPLTVAALEGDEIQVAILFTSDGVIAAKGFVLLDDDKGLQPAENVTPVIRTEIVDTYGDNLVNALDSVSAALTTTGLSEMNRRVGIDGDDPEQVAADWISANL